MYRICFLPIFLYNFLLKYDFNDQDNFFDAYYYAHTKQTHSLVSKSVYKILCKIGPKYFWFKRLSKSLRNVLHLCSLLIKTVCRDIFTQSAIYIWVFAQQHANGKCARRETVILSVLVHAYSCSSTLYML